MPKTRVHDIDMYYEIHGQGEPLAIVTGAGGRVENLSRLVSLYSDEFQLVLFDNRGAGRTDAPDMTYTTELMAADLAGLLDAIGIDSAHIQGTSMGGMIAQQFAVRHPKRVRSLVLMATYCGGPGSVLPPFEEWDFQRSTPEESTEALLQACVTPKFIEFNSDAYRHMLKLMAEYPPVGDGLKKHQQAVVTHDVYDRLPDIQVPTLILAGDADRILPVENARVLASRIPDAELMIFEHAGHFLAEVGDQVNRMALDFHKRHRTGD